MALLDNGHTTPTRPGIEAGELEAGLTKLMPFLRSFARSVAGNRELAEDLAQEALAKVWRSRSSFTPGSNLKAWVFTVLRNEFISHKRRAWRQAPWEAEWAETIPAAPDEQDRAIELSDAVRALHGLSQAQRQALMLVGLGGFAYDDAAVLASCRVGTMKSRVARARKAMRDMLESRSPLPAESRPANRNAIDELFAELTLASKQPC